MSTSEQIGTWAGWFIGGMLVLIVLIVLTIVVVVTWHMLRGVASQSTGTHSSNRRTRR